MLGKFVLGLISGSVVGGAALALLSLSLSGASSGLQGARTPESISPQPGSVGQPAEVALDRPDTDPMHLSADSTESADSPEAAASAPVMSAPQEARLAEPAPADGITLLPPVPAETAVATAEAAAVDTAAPDADIPEAAADQSFADSPAETPMAILEPEAAETAAVAPAVKDAAAAVVTARLPQITPEAPVEAGLATDLATDLAAPLAEDLGAQPPSMRFARPFTHAGSKPLFSIILFDDGTAQLDRSKLAALPFPVSFALDPNSAVAADAAAIYRAGNQEVVMLASTLPEGAQPSDVAVSFEAMARVLPESVAVMDIPTRRFQGDRHLASAVVPAVAEQGRGLITWNFGLNAADQVAKREDLPSAVIFRDLDAEGETAPVIRRYLDRAAFKAAQDGTVTVFGRLSNAGTLEALLEWSLEGRSANVTLAPVSAMLRVD